MNKQLYKTLATMALVFTANSQAVEVSGLIEAGYVSAQHDRPWLNNWADGGVGVLRFDNNNENVQFSQGILELKTEITNDISAEVVANLYPDGDKSFGITEAFATYAPITSGLRHKLKVGMFYPKMSLENVDRGWNSPYTYTYSAINSWIGEELRAVGAEYSISRNGRQYQSPHSFTGTAGVFKANDVFGAILTWRGWALHNRQSMLGEKLHFADYFQWQTIGHPMPTYGTVIEETDGRWGYYIGANWRYLRSTDVRLYYYDNNGDPNALEEDWQYAWDTEFYSLALQHKFNKNYRVLAQYMDGRTIMGSSYNGVHADFSSWYIMASMQQKKHRVSLRYDHFDVNETDHNFQDPNDSNGHSVTLAWRYKWDNSWNIGAEWLLVDSNNENRTLWPNWTARHKQKQLMAMVQYRF